MRISKKQFRNRIALDGIQFRQNSLLRGLHKVGYKKPAKDLAFDRERTKLQAEITQLRGRRRLYVPFCLLDLLYLAVDAVSIGGRRGNTEQYDTPKYSISQLVNI